VCLSDGAKRSCSAAATQWLLSVTRAATAIGVVKHRDLDSIMFYRVAMITFTARLSEHPLVAPIN
jgi:hypothetical protein